MTSSRDEKAEAKPTGRKFIEQFMKNHRRSLFFKLETTFNIVCDVDFISKEEFTKKIKAAIKLLKERSPDYYRLVCLFNKTIRVLSFDDCCALANFKNNSIDFGKNIISLSDIDVASTLVHEVIHFWQHESGKYPVWKFEGGKWVEINQQKPELEAFEHEAEVLTQLGADEKEINTVKRERGTHWQASQYFTRRVR